MSSQIGDTDPYRSDSVKAFNESFTRGSKDRAGLGSY